MADEVQQVDLHSETITGPESAPAIVESEAGEHERNDTVDPQAEGQDEPATLQPNGERFKQVWARAKEAERKAEALAAEAQREREARIRLEERDKVRQESQVTPEKEFSWQELRGLIAEGKLTMDQAVEYREEVVAKRIKREAQATIEGHLKLNTRESVIDETLTRYRKANPDLVKDGTPEREKLVREYKYHVEVLGMPATRATELAAARAAFGDVDALESQAKLKAKSVEREAFMETPGTQRPAPKTAAPSSKLPQDVKEHYLRLIKAGRYGSYRPKEGVQAEHWKAVDEELTWKRGKK